MIKVLAKSIREYKKPSVLAPIFVSGEVILECIIPFLTANLVNEIKGGMLHERAARLWRRAARDGRALPDLRRLPLRLRYGELRLRPQPCAKDMFVQDSGYSFEEHRPLLRVEPRDRLTTDTHEPCRWLT